MIKRTNTFAPDGSRYEFDFRLCNYENGWAQLDTTQDASYYGNWVNPTKLMLVSYAEGDICVTKCDDADEFKAVLREAIDWQRNNGFFKGIDAMCSPTMEAAFVRLGFADDLH